jgi:hypothetical protein
MHKNVTKYNKTQSKWCINKHGASKFIDTFETYQSARGLRGECKREEEEALAAVEEQLASK